MANADAQANLTTLLGNVEGARTKVSTAFDRACAASAAEVKASQDAAAAYVALAKDAAAEAEGEAMAYVTTAEALAQRVCALHDALNDIRGVQADVHAAHKTLDELERYLAELEAEP